ncbi:cobalamin B12-binding domain-containing protein [Streptomyces sp. NPDC088794]|uniref:cobalamin B12-binding domain-containing protein n=1 Tax=Streptomyces sp. NPDC088794 TaxID=3365902 RepID=UPI0037F16459
MSEYPITTPMPERSLRVVVSSVSSDAHMWNLVYLQLLLEEAGHEVTNLGVCPPDATVMDACRGADRPDLVVLSTVNGHGHLDGLRLIRAIRRDAELALLPVVIGGKLGVRGGDDGFGERLLDAGFNAVFNESEAPVARMLADFGAFLRTLAGNLAPREPAALAEAR